MSETVPSSTTPRPTVGALYRSTVNPATVVRVERVDADGVTVARVSDGAPATLSAARFARVYRPEDVEDVDPAEVAAQRAADALDVEPAPVAPVAPLTRAAQLDAHLVRRGTVKWHGSPVSGAMVADHDAAARNVERRGFRIMSARYAGTCARPECADPIVPGESIAYGGRGGSTFHAECCAMVEDRATGGRSSGGRGGRGRSGARARSGVVTYRTSSGHVDTRNARGRCEDAPCCGCCTF